MALDGNTIDAVARAMHSGTPRRGALGLLFGGALAAMDLPDSAAKKGKKKGGGKKKKCGKGKKLCGSQCIPAGNCCTDADCNYCAREICQEGVCNCHPELIRHNGVCGSYIPCQPAGTIVSSYHECCSEESVVDLDSGQERCLPGKFLCLTPIDCVDKGPCRGFMCTEFYNGTTGGKC